MSEINYQALREAAERAIPAMERLLMLPADDDLLSEQELKDYGVDIDALNAFKFLAGPETVLALLDERERNQQYIKRRDQENEDIALTVGKLRVELEGKDSKIANLTAERDALREGEMGDARHSNTRAAADIYFQLVEECEIPAGGSLVEYVDDMREKLEAAEKRIAELEMLAFNPALLDVISERQRQRAVEGWTSEHDDAYQNSELADAAACYAINAHNQGLSTPAHWPWAPDWWKQSGPRRDLVKAGALILAEIERIDRAAAGKGETS